MCINWSSSNYGRGENTTHGESECWGHSTSISRTEAMSIGPDAEAIGFCTPRRLLAATANPRVRSAAEPLQRRLRLLATQLTLAEFHALRVTLEDFFDECLLNSV